DDRAGRDAGRLRLRHAGGAAGAVLDDRRHLHAAVLFDAARLDAAEPGCRARCRRTRAHPEDGEGGDMSVRRPPEGQSVTEVVLFVAMGCTLACAVLAALAPVVRSTLRAATHCVINDECTTVADPAADRSPEACETAQAKLTRLSSGLHVLEDAIGR